MAATDHFGFIAAAYATAAVIVGVLIVWVALDYRALKRKLADLEMRGITRRSASARAEPDVEQVKEQA
jgi:heme exporter protein D